MGSMACLSPHRARLVLILGLFTGVAAFGSERIALHYHERPPYAQTEEDGSVSGLTASPAALALERAGIAFHWVRTPSNRQIQLLERNSGLDCMLGWFKNPQREQLGQFSLPLYQDKPTIGLALFSNLKLDSGISLQQALQDSSLRLLVKDGYSYGEVIDRLIEQLQPQRTITTVENINMLRMIALDRADYFFIAEEEASELIRQSEFKPADFKYIHFSNSPEGGRRHLWCSRQVADSSLAQINRAIAELTAVQPAEAME